MSNRNLIFILLLFSSFVLRSQTNSGQNLRAPAYPLVTIDPNTSAWSMSDNLYGDEVRHWTGKPFPLAGAVRVDGKVYRFMGTDTPEEGGSMETAANQRSAKTDATHTDYVFTCGGIRLEVSFMAPLLLDNLELVSRPVNYLSYRITSLDGKKHELEVYLEGSSLWALNTPEQKGETEGYRKGGMLYLKTGNENQEVLGKKGDDLRIDWGYFYLSASEVNTTYAVGNAASLRSSFAKEGKLNGEVGKTENGRMAMSRELGKVSSAKVIFLIGYDDLYSVQYFGQNLRPYWNRKGDKTLEDVLNEAEKEYPVLEKKCRTFDAELSKKANLAGGQEYAQLCALAYRQAISAHKLVESPAGDLLFPSKENNSNGSIGTVDVTYPSSPLFLYYNPKLAEGQMNPIYYYSESGKWTKPYPSHDVGTYPIANGQTYGGDMPVEEAGNMLCLTAAVAAAEGNASYAAKHWDVLTVWTNYLAEKGLDPENQLCTDDFAGHFAHNTNLSIKAILGIASYGYLAGKLGKKDIAEKYLSKAREMAKEWERMANDGDHYRLTFDKAGTWSQKYNLVWDKVLNLNIFPKVIVAKEIPYYLTKQNEYGLPLDSRKNYTKADWIVWTATLSPDKTTFEKFIAPLYQFMNETTDRVPMSDWYNTDSKTHVGFKARSVVGGYFMKMLEEKLLPKK